MEIKLVSVSIQQLNYHLFLFKRSVYKVCHLRSCPSAMALLRRASNNMHSGSPSGLWPVSVTTTGPCVVTYKVGVFSPCSGYHIAVLFVLILIVNWTIEDLSISCTAVAAHVHPDEFVISIHQRQHDDGVEAFVVVVD